jgi:hypothetical protein
MDLNEAVRVFRRQWYVTVPLLVLAMAATFGTYHAVSTKYQATTTFSLLASDQTVRGTTAVPGTNNAFMSFDSSLNDMADFLVRRVDAPDSAQQLQALGVTEAYSAALAANAEGPFITLTVTGSNAAHVSGSVSTLLKFSEQELAQIQTQASVDPSAMIGSVVIVPAGPPSPQLKSKIQAVIGVGVCGFVFALLATFAADSLAAPRRRRGRGPQRKGVRQPQARYLQAASEVEPVAIGPAEQADPDRTEVLTGLPEGRD